MLNARFKRTYKKSSGKVMFVYHISGDKQALDQFETIQGEHYRTDNGIPVWFTSRYVGESCPLLITSKDKIVADTSEFDKANSLVQQAGGHFGEALANALAARYAHLRSAPQAPEPPPEPDPE
jgi:hypothetical protein